MNKDDSSKAEFNVRYHGNHVWDTYSHQMKYGFKDEFGQYKPVLVRKMKGSQSRNKTPLPTATTFNVDSEHQIDTAGNNIGVMKCFPKTKNTFLKDMKSYGVKQAKPVFSVSTGKKTKY